jgi:L-iditol 2-dehydrogenase
MGLMHIMVASALGATVYASDFRPERRAAAERAGAVKTFAPSEAADLLSAATGGILADAVICGPGSATALEHAVDSVASDGTVVMFTPLAPEERFVFDQSTAYFRDVRLVASYSCGPDDTAEALRLISAGVVSAARLHVTEFEFPAVAEAYELMQRADVVKAIVTF